MSVMKYARVAALAGTAYLVGDAAFDGINHVGMTQAFASCGGCTAGGGPFGGGSGPSGPSGGSEVSTSSGDRFIVPKGTASICGCATGTMIWHDDPTKAFQYVVKDRSCQNPEVATFWEVPGEKGSGVRYFTPITGPATADRYDWKASSRSMCPNNYMKPQR